MDLDVLNTDVSIGCRASCDRFGCIGADRWEPPPSLPVFTALVFHEEQSVFSHVSADPVQRDPERHESPVSSHNGCQIKTSLSQQFYYVLNYGYVPGLCITVLEAAQTTCSKSLFCFAFVYFRSGLLLRRVLSLKKKKKLFLHPKHLPSKKCS